MNIQWDSLTATFLVVAAVTVVFGRPFLRLVDRWKRPPTPEPFSDEVEEAAARLLDGYDWDSALEWFFYDEGVYYGPVNDPWAGVWDDEGWLDVADAAGVTPEAEQ